MSTIVVGVDGSAGARTALRFAVEEARLRGATLRVVAAWQIPAMAYSGGYGPGDGELFADLEDEARRNLQEALKDAADGVEAEQVVREGLASSVLLDEARDADMLVVGSRGLGGFRGLLLGSVSQQCAHHASCPLAIVPHRPDL